MFNGWRLLSAFFLSSLLAQLLFALSFLTPPPALTLPYATYR